MNICSLSSGSKGNSLFIESEHTRVLVDIGLSARQITQRLQSVSVEADSIDAIVLTHSHNDHIRGAGVFSRQNGTPIYGHPETLDDLLRYLRGREPLVPWENTFQIKDLRFTPFRVSHDAFPTVGYLISDGSKTIAVCTDTGCVTPEIEEHLAQAGFIVLESNHDPDMLMDGPYPWDLKDRIASRVGHLSNRDAGSLLRSLLNGRIEKVLLAHLSEENNTPQLARDTVLELVGARYENLIDVVGQKIVSPVYRF